MTPARIIRQATADGLTLILTPAGAIKVTGVSDAVHRWQAILREHKPGIVAALQRAANDAAPEPAGAHRRWSIQFSGLRVGEAIFHPEVTRDEAIAAFPGSMAATPRPETPLRPPTHAEREELIQLIDTVLPGDPEGQYEALTIALADVDNALVCFRRLAVERHERS